MDLVSSLPLSASKKNTIWVIMERLTKLTHFIVVTNNSLERIIKIYISKIVFLHGIPSSIVSDEDLSSHLGFGSNYKDNQTLFQHNLSSFHPWSV